jgi:hypothetical protein
MPAGEPLTPTGTPTVTYVSLYQLKKLGVNYGAVARVVPSQIENFETIVHLHWLRQRYPGVAVEELLKYTASVNYPETMVIQAGGEVSAVRVRPGTGVTQEVGVLMAETEAGEIGAANQEKLRLRHDAILQRYGFDRKTAMFMKFYIDMDVVPFSGVKPPTSPPAGGGKP